MTYSKDLGGWKAMPERDDPPLPTDNANPSPADPAWPSAAGSRDAALPPLGPPLTMGQVFPTSADQPSPLAAKDIQPDWMPGGEGASLSIRQRRRASSALAGAITPIAPRPSSTQAPTGGMAGGADSGAPGRVTPPDPSAAADGQMQSQATLPAKEPPSGRARTRLLGFQQDAGLEIDPFDQTAARAHPPVSFPTGWLVLLEGPGRGACFTLTEGVSQIGRGADQPVRLDYGDQAVSRQGHASVAYDDEMGQFFLGHGGKANLVRLNGKPVLSTEELTSGDQIRIGETTLLFVALCGPDFSWREAEDQREGSDDAKPEA